MILTSLAYLPDASLLLSVTASVGFTAFIFARRNPPPALAATISTFQFGVRANHKAFFVALCAMAPALLILLVHILSVDRMAQALISYELADNIRYLPILERQVYLDKLAEYAGMEAAAPTNDAFFNAARQRFTALKGQLTLAAIGVAILAASGAFLLASREYRNHSSSRNHIEIVINWVLFLCALIAILTTLGIVVSLFLETLRFFATAGSPSLPAFIFSTDWNAQTEENFGALPLFFGTVIIAILAMIVAAPIGLFSAIFMSEYASPKVRSMIKPVLEILAGIPTVVYGFFAALTVAPLIRRGAEWINNLPIVPDDFFAAQPQSALAAAIVMGIMIVPTVSSLSDDIINAVPQSLREAALAVGTTKSEMIKGVVLPVALPGIIAALLLGLSRAIGETMIVVMAAGQRAQITLDPTSDMTTITAEIVALLTGDTAFDSVKTLSAFALGSVLFIVTLGFNLIALRVVRTYRQKYE